MAFRYYFAENLVKSRLINNSQFQLNTKAVKIVEEGVCQKITIAESALSSHTNPSLDV